MSEKIRTIKHKDKRANIPTSELRGFVEHEEKRPKTRLYPCYPSLDPQLVWKGYEARSLLLGRTGDSVPEAGWVYAGTHM